VALKAGRTAEALLIAEAGGPELHAQIKEDFFNQHKDPFVKEIINAVAKKDFSDLLDQVASLEQMPNQQLRQLGHCTWRESLAYVLAYHNEGKLKEVAKSLADQLLKNKTDINSAIVCYILANELDMVTDLWKKRALYHIRKVGVSKNEALFVLYQKSFLLMKAFGNVQPNGNIDLFLAEFAEFLNAEGEPSLALKVLQSASNGRVEVLSLHQRLVQQLGPAEVRQYQ